MLSISVATIYLLLITVTIAFQVGLVLGKPWGEWTMGGLNKGVLPIKFKFAAFLSIIILFFFGLVVIDHVNLFGIDLGFPVFLMWIVIGYSILAVIANAATKSQKERKLWLPITIVMLISSLYLFLS